jgi:PKD domain
MMRPRHALLLPALAVVLLAFAGPLTAGARAVIHPATVIDGPSDAILDVAGAAMAPDGTGGVLYRKQVEGVTHLFAVPFRDGVWGAPAQVDVEDPYGASEPAIAAGNGGRLLVVWVQPRNVGSGNVTEYALMSASLQPGASGFGQAIAVDTHVGEPDTGDISGVDPRLAMAPDGVAYVVYRVTLDDCALGDEGNPELAKCRPGSTDKVVSVRAARFDYLTWSSLGQINRDPQLAMRNPTAQNAPAVGIALDGNGVVSWQEPEPGGAARIWTRRLFGTVKGNVLQASPTSIGGRPVTSDADAPAVAVGPYGEARVAFRILGGQGSAVGTTQLYLDTMLSEIAPHGSELQGPIPVADAAGANLGPASAAVSSETGFRLAWSLDGEVHDLEGGAHHGEPVVVALGTGTGAPLSAINPAGGGTTAWSAPAGAPPAVEVREDYAKGAFQTAQLAGSAPGAVSGLALGGDGQGDALIGFMQGPPGRAEVLGAFVQAPPAPFVLSTPVGWVRGGQAKISWEGALDAVEGVTYTVYVDGRARLTGLKGLSARLSATGLGDGVHHVQVLARDSDGQQTMSARSELMVDADPPAVRVRLIDHRHGVRVSVRDAASGVDVGATRISFGDGAKAIGSTHARHLYRHAGTYRITASVRDNVGNHATVHLRVRVL